MSEEGAGLHGGPAPPECLQGKLVSPDGTGPQRLVNGSTETCVALLRNLRKSDSWVTQGPSLPRPTRLVPSPGSGIWETSLGNFTPDTASRPESPLGYFCGCPGGETKAGDGWGSKRNLYSQSHHFFLALPLHSLPLLWSLTPGLDRAADVSVFPGFNLLFSEFFFFNNTNFLKVAFLIHILKILSDWIADENCKYPREKAARHCACEQGHTISEGSEAAWCC